MTFGGAPRRAAAVAAPPAPLPSADMSRYCAGEASAKFKVSPRDITTQNAKQTQGMYEVWGQYGSQRPGVHLLVQRRTAVPERRPVPSVTMRSGGRWAVVAALLAGVVFAWPTYVRYFGLHPGPMVAALLIAFAMYLPSLWAIRYLDRHEPEPPLLFWGSVAFVILFAPITSRVMHVDHRQRAAPVLGRGRTARGTDQAVAAAADRRARAAVRPLDAGRHRLRRTRRAGFRHRRVRGQLRDQRLSRRTAGPTCARPSQPAGRSAPKATSSGARLPALAWATS